MNIDFCVNILKHLKASRTNICYCTLISKIIYTKASTKGSKHFTVLSSLQQIQVLITNMLKVNPTTFYFVILLECESIYYKVSKVVGPTKKYDGRT